MTCIEDLTQRLAEVGLAPLPSHYNSLLEAICGGISPEVIAKFLHRMHEWPRLLLMLSRRYKISDEEYDKLLDCYLSNGKSVVFQLEVKKLSVQNDSAPDIAWDSFEMKLAQKKVVEAYRTGEFDKFLKQQGLQMDKISNADKEEINALRKRYILGELVAKDLLNAWTTALPKPGGS